MFSFIISSNSQAEQKEKVEKLLSPFAIAPVDITYLSSDASIGIAEIKSLKQKIALKPFQSKKKAIVIESAQSLTTEAQNALLKTLEEPPNDTLILLLTTNLETLLPTILSRCQIIESLTKTDELLDKQNQEITTHLHIIQSTSIGSKLALAQEVTKTKETALNWVTFVTILLRAKLHATLDDTSKIYMYTKILIQFHQLALLLQTTNISPRLAVENTLLTLTE